MYKRILSLFVVFALFFSSSSNVFASSETEKRDYNIESRFVKELFLMDSTDIKSLSNNDSNQLFYKAFGVNAKTYPHEEVLLALEGLSNFYKIQQNSKSNSINLMAAKANSSTKGNISYSQNKGLAWVRDTSSNKSPLKLGEVISGVYTLEVDYVSYAEIAIILAASADKNYFNELVEQVALGASSSTMTAIVAAQLGLTGLPVTITSVAVGAVVGVGWSWLKTIDRNNMFKCWEKMKKNQFVKVSYVTASNMVNKTYSAYTPSKSVFTNPYPGTYGTWYTNKYGYLYKL